MALDSEHDKQIELWGEAVWSNEIGGLTNTRKERILLVPVCLFLDCVAGKRSLKLPAEIPSDSICLRVFQDTPTNSVCMVLYHPSFPNIPSGVSIPKYSVVVEERFMGFADLAHRPSDDIVEEHDSEREI